MAQFLVLNFLLVIGMLLALLTWYFYAKVQKFILNSKPVIGKVIDLQDRNGKSIVGVENPSRFVCTPIIQFSSYGKTIIHKSNFYTNTPKHIIGDNVKLLFNPVKNKVKENNSYNLYAVPIALGINAAILIVIGLIVLNLLPQNIRQF